MQTAKLMACILSHSWISPGVVFVPASSESPGKFLKMTVPGPHPGSHETEPEGGWSRQLRFPPAPGRPFSVQRPRPPREGKPRSSPVLSPLRRI